MRCVRVCFRAICYKDRMLGAGSRRTLALFGLLGLVGTSVILAAGPAAAEPIGYSVRSDFDGQLYSIDLATGDATAIGATGFDDIECLSFSADGTLYGVDDDTDQLLTIDTGTGAGTVVGALGVDFTDCGLTFDAAGNLFMSSDAPPDLFQLDPETGAATLVGSQGQEVTGLAANCDTIYGLGGDDTDNLVTIDPATGEATEVGPLINVTVSDGGIDFDVGPDGLLWGINDEDPSVIFTIDITTGEATVVANATVEGSDAGGFESLAITGDACIPPPPPPPPPPEPIPAPIVLEPTFTG